MGAMATIGPDLTEDSISQPPLLPQAQRSSHSEIAM